MGYWCYMLLIALLMPLIMVGTGWYFQKKAPKRISNFFGYRTARSMKSPEAWAFANGYMGMLWFRLGLILLPLTAAVMVLFRENPKGAASVVTLVQLAVILLTVLPVERKLKENFDETGAPRG